MSESLTDLAARLIDERITDEPSNRITEELSEIADGVAIVESFSHVVAVRTDDGLVAFDSSSERKGPAVVGALRTWSSDPVHSLVYTHGHADHVGGSPAFAVEAEAQGRPAPRVIGHEAVTPRLDRYDLTNGYNLAINLRQFGGVPRSPVGEVGVGGDARFLPAEVLRPDLTYTDTHRESVGGLEFDLRHARGETDDHTWTWIPALKMISCGDLFMWNFPNCGNPQKVQRYPSEWAEALRAMIACEPELLVPAHGLPIAGFERIRMCLDVSATALETLVADVLDAMNSGAPLDAIVHSVRVDPDVLALPFLRPLYDEPEFVVRNIWRLYGGWWDGNPARLKPAPDADLAAELARLAGGAEALIARAQELSEAGEHRLACHLAQFAGDAEPTSVSVHGRRAEIYEARRKAERSLMAKGIFASARAESELVATGEVARTRFNLSLGEEQ